MHYEAFDDAIIVEKYADEHDGKKLLLPDQSSFTQALCRVQSVGPGRFLDNGQRAKIALNAGDVIVIESNTKYQYVDPSTGLFVVRPENVLARRRDRIAEALKGAAPN